MRLRWWDGQDPTKPVTPEKPEVAIDPRQAMLKWFAFGHLKEDLQRISHPFANVATWMINNLPPGPEATMAMRKLLEAKDCAVRAALDASVKSVVEKAMENDRKEHEAGTITGAGPGQTEPR